MMNNLHLAVGYIAQTKKTEGRDRHIIMERYQSLRQPKATRKQKRLTMIRRHVCRQNFVNCNSKP
jgi:hypothetical protein